MQRYKLVIAYDGSGYAGWQVQPGRPTVQAALEAALRRLTTESRRVCASGRTDRGVHARQQVAHVDLCGAPLPVELRRGLNALLPGDIRVLSVAGAAPGFHARKSARGKEYRYFIWNGDVVPPFLRNVRTRIAARLDVPRMNQAAARLVGRRDFAAFTANPNRPVGSTVRQLTALRVRRHGCDVVIAARGEGFLYKMVRSLVGFLIRVGEGALPPEAAEQILDSRARTARVPTAPPGGLFLWRVWY